MRQGNRATQEPHVPTSKTPTSANVNLDTKEMESTAEVSGSHICFLLPKAFSLRASYRSVDNKCTSETGLRVFFAGGSRLVRSIHRWDIFSHELRVQYISFHFTKKLKERMCLKLS